MPWYKIVWSWIVFSSCRGPLIMCVSVFIFAFHFNKNFANIDFHRICALYLYYIIWLTIVKNHGSLIPFMTLFLNFWKKKHKITSSGFYSAEHFWCRETVDIFYIDKESENTQTLAGDVIGAIFQSAKNRNK